MSLTVTAAEIDPELWAQRETVGTIEVPGLGRRLVDREDWLWIRRCAVVEIPIADLARVTDWPYVGIGIRVPELSEWSHCDSVRSDIRDALWSEGDGRWPSVLAVFAKHWLEVQREQNRPKDAKVADPRAADPPVTPEPVVWGTDFLTGEPHTAYAALIHRVEGCKGSIYDRGWEIRWYDEAEEAAKRDAEGRREAASHMEARRLEAELAAAAEAVELPVAVPAAFVSFTATLDEVLRMLGIEQFRIEGEGPVQVCVKQAEYYWSKMREESQILSSAVFASRWWQKDGEMVVVFANATARDLLGQDSLGHNDAASAGQLCATMDKILAVRLQLAAEHDAAEQAYRASLAAFVRALQAESAYASLSSEMQDKLAKLEDAYGTPSVDAEELRREWGKAVVLHNREQRGEGLANFGGHFRRMGATGNVDFWVVRPDGSLRDPDEVQYRKRYTSEGEKYWRMVGPGELALTWSKAYTAAPHEFSVAKLPMGGCTPEQLTTVRRIEAEVASGFNASIGRGWGLGAEPVRVIDPGCAMPSEPPSASVSAPVSLADLRAKFGKKR